MSAAEAAALTTNQHEGDASLGVRGTASPGEEGDASLGVRETASPGEEGFAGGEGDGFA